MPFFGTNIYYELFSPALPTQTITLLNGYRRPGTDFRRFGKALVGADMEVIVPDNRGAGKSIADGYFTVEDMATDVFSLWKHLQVKNSIVLGISMGGAIAQLLAINYPEMVKKLIIVSSFPNNKFKAKYDRGWPKDLSSIQQRLENYVAPVFYQKNKPLLQAFAKQVYQQLSESATACAQERAIRDFDVTAQLSHITCPTLIIHGKKDKVVDPQSALFMAQNMANATPFFVPDAGHMLLIESPDVLLDQILRFC